VIHRFTETFEKCSILFKFKEDENTTPYDLPDLRAGTNTLSILRIELKLHFVQNVESDAEIGQKGTFCKGLILSNIVASQSVIKNRIIADSLHMLVSEFIGKLSIVHRATR